MRSDPGLIWCNGVPMKAIRPKAMAAFVAAEVRAAARPPPPPASRGIATKSGTTARSWYRENKKRDTAEEFASNGNENKSAKTS